MTTSLQLAILRKKKAVDFMKAKTKDFYELVEEGKAVRIHKSFIKCVVKNGNSAAGVRIYRPDGTIRFVSNESAEEVFNY